MREARDRHYSEAPLAGVDSLSSGWGRLLPFRESVFSTAGHQSRRRQLQHRNGRKGSRQEVPTALALGRRRIELHPTCVARLLSRAVVVASRRRCPGVGGVGAFCPSPAWTPMCFVSTWPLLVSVGPGVPRFFANAERYDSTGGCCKVRRRVRPGPFNSDDGARVLSPTHPHFT